jgi:hypothetical protein
MQVKHANSSTKLQKEPKVMKREFTTNWYIYRACLSSISIEPKVQRDTNEKVSSQEESPPRDHGFENLLLEAVDEGLSSLGDSPKQAIYFYLEKTFKIKKPDIPNKIEEFANALEKIFGHGAKLLEIQIMKRLYEKFGHAFEYFSEKDDLRFVEYMEAARLSNQYY